MDIFTCASWGTQLGAWLETVQPPEPPEISSSGTRNKSPGGFSPVTPPSKQAQNINCYNRKFEFVMVVVLPKNGFGAGCCGYAQDAPFKIDTSPPLMLASVRVRWDPDNYEDSETAKTPKTAKSLRILKTVR